MDDEGRSTQESVNIESAVSLRKSRVLACGGPDIPTLTVGCVARKPVRKASPREVYEKRKTEIREGRFFPRLTHRPDVVLSGAIDDYLKRKENVLRHFRHYRRLGRYWKDAYGSRTLTSIQPADIEKYAAKRLEKAAPATVNRELAFLKRIYFDAMQNGKTSSNPVRSVKMFTENNARVRFLTDDDEGKLRAVMSPDDWRLVVLALNTGLRQAEQSICAGNT